MPPDFNFQCRSFSDLNTHALYELMQLRQDVFIVEQDCPYLDADGKDQAGHHILIHDQNILAAYARLLPKGISYEHYCSIGRVVTSKLYRRINLGKKLMTYSIEQCQLLYPNIDIKISAQCYLLDFYREFQFVDIGDEYLEDDIPHKAMIRKQP